MQRCIFAVSFEWQSECNTRLSRPSINTPAAFFEAIQSTASHSDPFSCPAYSPVESVRHKAKRHSLTHLLTYSLIYSHDNEAKGEAPDTQHPSSASLDQQYLNGICEFIHGTHSFLTSLFNLST